MQFKYKVGDKVRVAECNRLGCYKMENGIGLGWAVVPPMRELAGKVVTIKEVDEPQNCYHIDNTGLRWTDEMFEGLAVENNKIVITHDGKTTTATLYREDGSKEVASAKCSPEDTFDFNVGAKLAMERLMEKTKKPEPPKYFNGKVVCIENDNYNDQFTVGKIYEIVEGKFTDNNGSIRPMCSDRVIHLNEGYFKTWPFKFIPIVE